MSRIASQPNLTSVINPQMVWVSTGFRPQESESETFSGVVVGEPGRRRAASITGTVTIPTDGAEGMIVSPGGWFGGNSLYLLKAGIRLCRIALPEHRFKVEARPHCRPGRTTSGWVTPTTAEPVARAAQRDAVCLRAIPPSAPARRRSGPWPCATRSSLRTCQGP